MFPEMSNLKFVLSYLFYETVEQIYNFGICFGRF